MKPSSPSMPLQGRAAAHPVPGAADQPERWLAGPDGAFFACHRPGRLTFVNAGDATVLELHGGLADQLAERCRQGRPPSSVLNSRLKALAVSLDNETRELILALQQGLFRPATPRDLIRADGYHQLWIELTAHCNERCVHCYAEAGPDRTDSLDCATVLATIADAVKLGFSRIQLTGGDPLLCPFLLDAVAAARAAGLEVEVFTNGLLLDPALLQSLLAHGVSFAFSLYGAEPTTHDRVTRTAGSFLRTVAAVRRAVAAGAEVRIGVVVVAENVDAAQETLAFGRTLVTTPYKVRLVIAREVGRGRIAPDLLTAEHQPCDDLLPPPQARVAHGRAALCADGEVRPCIFTRWLSLGCVGRDGSLADILEAPQVTSKSRPMPTLEAFCADRLTCRFCRRTAISLEHLAHAPAPT